MIENLLKPIKWFDFDDIHGNKTSTTATIICEYDVEASGNGYEVNYYNRQTEAPSKTATGFKTMEEAKQWAWEHYIEKMTPYLNPDWSKHAVTPYVREVFADWARTDPLTDTLNWFKEAKPEPTDKDKTTQLACVFEEVAELAFAVGLASTGEKLLSVSSELKTLSCEQAELFVKKINNIEALDATTDTKVTLVGFEYMMGYNGNGALTEVNASNWSKFVDGKAVTDENGKIIKGSGYFKPELDKFVGSHVIEEVIADGIKLTVTKNSDGSVHFKSCVEGDYE